MLHWPRTCDGICQLFVQFEYIKNCKHYGTNDSKELCEENSGLARMKKTLGCLPLELAGQHQQSHHCEGSPLSPNKTKEFAIFVKKIENLCAAKLCTKVANIV